MAMKLFLKIFFLLPVWLLRCMTFQKSTVINKQINAEAVEIYEERVALLLERRRVSADAMRGKKSTKNPKLIN